MIATVESFSVARVLGDTIDGALANNSYEHYAEHLDAVRALTRTRTG